MLKILLTTEDGPTKQTYFPPTALAALEKLGQVVYNPNQGEPFSEAQLSAAVRDVDVCVTHWGCPQFSSAVLQNANRLKLIAHAAGSVADLVTPEVYARGIKVCSANTVMAKYVAEGVLAYILTGLKHLPQQIQRVKFGGWHSPDTMKSLFEAQVGLVGLGTIGRFLLDLLEPFHVQVKVFDPYLAPGALAGYANVQTAGLEEVLAWGDVISIHASLTRETRGMLDAGRLALIRSGALLVNTARGPIIDETALARELQAGRFSAVLDVYTHEPLPMNSPLRGLDNALIFPHSVGTTDRGIEMTTAMLAEIERFTRGEALQYEISLEKSRLMTQQRDFDIYKG
jgi:phosphoglycerate dehydrogenase-like enzyme